MRNIKQKITNPMTIIAIFATLSEASAAVSLPFLDNKEREVYIWFLISFPFYLLLLFFATLNFNYRSLYAPSDFEKEKHFIKAMSTAERPENIANAQDPPSGIGPHLPLSAPHHICLFERPKDLYIIDARWMRKKTDFIKLMEKIQKSQGKTAHVILFLTCAESQISLQESVVEKSKHVKKHSRTTFCIAYNLNSQGVTVIDEYVPNDTQPSAVFEDQSQGKCQEGIARS
jgi:hypothetical protein